MYIHRKLDIRLIYAHIYDMRVYLYIYIERERGMHAHMCRHVLLLVSTDSRTLALSSSSFAGSLKSKP